MNNKTMVANPILLMALKRPYLTGHDEISCNVIKITLVLLETFLRICLIYQLTKGSSQMT